MRKLQCIVRKPHCTAHAPTLDSELPSFSDLEPKLRAMEIGLFLPTRKQLDLRS